MIRSFLFHLIGNQNRRSTVVQSDRTRRPRKCTFETLETRRTFAASFSTAKFDFGTASSPVESGYVRVTEATRFDATTGYGWSAGTIYSYDRATGSLVNRDFNYMPTGTFSVTVPNGMYQVNLQLGDLGSYAHDQVGVFFENVQRDTVSTSARQMVTRSYTLQVTDNQLDLRLTDLGGSDRNCVIAGMDFTLVTPVLTVADAGVMEGNQGESSLRFVARLSAPSSQPVRLQYTTKDVSATSGSDYVAASGTLTIPAGASSGVISIRTIGDTTIESDETLRLLLSSLDNVLLDRTDIQGMIWNDDVPPTLKLSLPVGPYSEARTEPVVATLTRTGTTAQSLTVRLASDDVSEARVPATVVIPAGQSSATFPITLVDDLEIDGQRTVRIIANSTGYVRAVSQILVDDNEQPPFFRLFDFATTETTLTTGGFAKVAASTSYNVARGYGFTSGAAASLDRGGASLVRDAIYTRDVTFSVDISNGPYRVDMILGDTANYLHDAMGIYLEGSLVDSVTTAGGMLASRSFQTTVSDGQLTIRLRDLGGSDANVVVQAIRISAATAPPSNEFAWPAQSSIPNAVFTGPTTNADGFVNYLVYSNYQRSVNTLRVLLPTNYDPKVAYRIIYVLPVEAREGRQFGDGLLTVRSQGLQDRYNAIFVAPSFTDIPWYADHATNTGIWQETYFKDVVVPFIETQYRTFAGPEGRYLLGFSKSGYGAIGMLLRHQDYFGRVIAWDSPLAMSQPSQGFGFSGIVGTTSNFTQNYQITNLLTTRGATLKGQPPRIFLLGYATTYGCYADHQAIAAQMTQLDIPHRYDPGVKRSHIWASGWMPDAVAMLLS